MTPIRGDRSQGKANPEPKPHPLSPVKYVKIHADQKYNPIHGMAIGNIWHEF
ncbi:hypothetical protein [Laspinema olomoucense]|uniref:hypothetical protein n=1 Tax=Laspinema olomoucense TaxID=3231600 RepID=UPI0021BB4673|nr:hypothetical protein [Laspinema sp. D3d]MCT7971811.1 hypothetical protein [Laspinema sp. D3d]